MTVPSLSVCLNTEGNVCCFGLTCALTLSIPEWWQHKWLVKLERTPHTKFTKRVSVLFMLFRPSHQGCNVLGKQNVPRQEIYMIQSAALSAAPMLAMLNWDTPAHEDQAATDLHRPTNSLLEIYSHVKCMWSVSIDKHSISVTLYLFFFFCINREPLHHTHQTHIWFAIFVGTLHRCNAFLDSIFKSDKVFIIYEYFTSLLERLSH